MNLLSYGTDAECFRKELAGTDYYLKLQPISTNVARVSLETKKIKMEVDISGLMIIDFEGNSLRPVNNNYFISWLGNYEVYYHGKQVLTLHSKRCHEIVSE